MDRGKRGGGKWMSDGGSDWRRSRDHGGEDVVLGRCW